MQRFSEVIVIILALFFFCPGVSRATVSDLPRMDRTAIQERISEAEKNGAWFQQITGEIVTAGKERLILFSTEGAPTEYFLEDAEVYLNGLPSTGEALRPIFPGRYFQARLYLDVQGKVRFVEAWYIGGEARLVKVEPQPGGDRYSVTVRGLDTPHVVRFMISQELATLVKKLPPGTLIYYSLNIKGEINYILVSE